MKKVSFLVALLAIAQIAMGQRIGQAQQRLPDDRRAVEEALESAGQDIGEELEGLFDELGITADQLGHTLERWAEDNSEELDNWSAKYAKKWELWGNRFEQKLNRMAHEQEGIWQTWSKNYEQDLNKWVTELESDEIGPEHLGEFVERNLDMLSKMPLGKMVDQVLEDGIGELSDAPWESLEELGALAQGALEKPLGEIAEILDEESDQRRALERGAQELGQSLNRLKKDIDRNLSDAEVQQDLPTDSKIDPRVKALQKLRQRENVTPAQQERIDQIIRTIVDAEKVQKGIQSDPIHRPRVVVPHGDQIKRKVEREKSRQKQTLEQFNDDLLRSSEESRKSDMKARELESRKPKRVDGKNLDPNSKSKQKSDQNPLRRVQRDRRSPQNPSSQSATRGTKQNSQVPDIDSDLELLRREIAKLRNEVKRLKEESDK